MVIAKATQEIIPIKEIREGVIVLKDGSLKMVVMASSLNFALKSEDEQNATILQYQNFLNSLDFPIQFFIESRKLNINPYLANLQSAEKEQANELLKIQIREYMEFIKNFVKSTDIVSKSFYIVVSYKPSFASGQKGIFAGLLGKKTASQKISDQKDQFEENRLQLQQKADMVKQGLARCGVRVAPLATEELIELFYKLYNPGELEKELV
ncbi:MAG: hypothetical protein HY773_00730 [Candidatus Terrybacteria bacterium]|nr:hypothetical protein [Candidatus Terrybacteria bacterium]